MTAHSIPTSLAQATHSGVVARLAAFAQASAAEHPCGPAKPWRSRDRAIRYAAAPPYYETASGILDPRFRGDDSYNCGNTDRHNTSLWLWVPAFAGTTVFFKETPSTW
ncbi:hypothetical protein AYJ54_08695 [Bradyrhizobium centrolobii]|uniref:Uncharacterized protein n=1 Tax=Bradyrhizobium centrolobii TaxID=1505087 RepID=A0A176YUI4_9BRAD|nr:hypothetical protein AYJ54_08695 [Bradyrhizobium centrolobii]